MMSDGELGEAVRALQARLDIIRGGAIDPTKYPPRHRLRLMLTLQTIASFLEEAGTSSRHCHTLMDMVDALMELDQGTVRPYLRPTPGFANRHLDGGDVWRARAEVSTAFYLLHKKAGLTRDEASRHVAKYRHLRSLAGRQAKGLDSASKSWFDSFEKGRVVNQAAAALYADNVWTIDERVRSRSLTSAAMVDFADRMLGNPDIFAVSLPSD